MVLFKIATYRVHAHNCFCFSTYPFIPKLVLSRHNSVATLLWLLDFWTGFSFVNPALHILNIWTCSPSYLIYIRKTPNLVGCIGALKEALRLKANTMRVSAGSITPSSHNLNITTKTIFKVRGRTTFFEALQRRVKKACTQHLFQLKDENLDITMENRAIIVCSRFLHLFPHCFTSIKIHFTPFWRYGQMHCGYFGFNFHLTLEYPEFL